MMCSFRVICQAVKKEEGVLAPATRCLLSRFDELRPVVPDAVDSRADYPRCQDGLRQGVQQVLDVVLVGQIRVQPLSEAVSRDDDRGTVVDVAYLRAARR
jgi:hypothetical protein